MLVPLSSSSAVGRELQSPSQLLVDSSDCDKANQAKSQHVVNDSEVRRMIQMLEQQTSSAALQGKCRAGFCASTCHEVSFHEKYYMNLVSESSVRVKVKF